MYLRIDNGNFGFVKEGIHDIKETDILIKDEEYNKFFELQTQGKEFILRKLFLGAELFDYIEELTRMYQ